MGFGVGEYVVARARVLDRHGEVWADRLDLLRSSLEYGPTYRRSVWDHLSNALHALGKGEPESAEYWYRQACCARGLHHWETDWTTCRECGAQSQYAPGFLVDSLA